MIEPALRALGPRSSEAEGLLRQWVEQNSYTSCPQDVDAMGALLARAMLPTGMQVSTRRGVRYGTHYLFTTPAFRSEDAARVLLVGHHDTVFPPGTFEGYRQEGDVARGPGVLDMKGGLVTVRTALCALADARLLDDMPLAFVCVADEEVGSPESAAFTAEVARGASAALVFEAGRAQDAIITRRKGTGAVSLSVTGKAAHAGNHHDQGVNAIWALARMIDECQRLTQYERGVTVNVGTVSGGTSKNTVPAQASCEIDFRFESREHGEDTAKAIRELAESVAKETGVTVAVEGGVRRPPLERSEASERLYARYAAAATAAGLGSTEAALLGGGSDANNVSALGVPAIDGLGPRGRGFHTHDEFIEVSSLALRSEALVRFLCDA